MEFGLDAYNKVINNMQTRAQSEGVDLKVLYDKDDPPSKLETEPDVVSYWDFIVDCARTPDAVPKPGEWTAIDCGANIGEISSSFLDKGAKVYAFEPNKAAFNILEQRMSDHPWVVCYNMAVSDKNENTKLYLHKN